MEKEKISCLAKKRHAFEKRRFPTFLWKKNSLIITNFLENVSTPEGWMLWNFPDARNGLGWMHKLIKEHILETLGWLKIEEMNPEP